MEPAQHERNWQDLTHVIAILIEKYLSILKYYILSMGETVQDWSISIANALETLKSCLKQSIYSQYTAVRLTILYNTKYERKAITLLRQQSHKRHPISHS